MALFANDARKVKTKKVKNQVQRRRSKFSNEGVETVVEVKTVGDIPPVIEARRLIGETDINSAAKVLFKAARDDYLKYFSVVNSSNDGNRHFFINELSNFKVKVPEMGYVDNTTILDSLNKVETTDDNQSDRVNALKKLTSFYLDYYEKARFSADYEFDGEELVNRFSDIYNYMDIMRLYFSSPHDGRV